jgi:hypothetical protein
MVDVCFLHQRFDKTIAASGREHQLALSTGLLPVP